MRLERLAVGGFGRLRAGLELEFGPGLNLILAPNEAGKTTLAELITSLLYGFGKRRAGVHPFEPWQGGETGGEIVYSLEPQGRYVLRRHLVRRGDKLSLTDEAGRPVELSGRQPGEAHLGLGRGVFLTVSRIQLDDLHGAFSGDGKVGAKARQDLKGYFFQEAASRGRTENPVAVQADWERRAKALYSADKRSGKADQALSERIMQAREELAQARASEEEARRVSRELDELDQKARALEIRASQARVELEKARAGLERSRLLARRGEIQAEMAGLTNQGLADQALKQRARDLEKESRRAGEEAAGLRARAAGLAARAEPSPGSDDPEKARRELGRLEKRLADLKARGKQLGERESRLEEARAEIRADWGMKAERLARMDEGLPFALGRAREALERAREEAAAHRRKLAALGPRPDAKPWSPPLGLGAAALGLVLWVWQYLYPTGGWAVPAGAAALLAGLGLAWLGLAGKRRREAWELRRAELGDPDLLVESARAALAEIAAPWGLDAEKTDPGRLAAQRARAADLAREAEALAAARAGLQEGRRELAGRLAELGGDASQGLGAALDRLKDRLQKASRARAEVQRLEKEAQARQQTARAREQELNALLDSAELTDLKALHEAALRSRRVRELGAQLDEVHQQLGGEPQPLERADPRAAQEAMDGSRTRLENLETQLREMGAERGRRQERLARLNQLPGAAQAEAAREELEQRRRDLAREHTVTLLAGALLAEAMESFHLEAQPSLIHRAGEYLARISGGAYQWLGSDLFRPDRGGEPQLKARSAPGAPEREAADLSRGARDQLYLCLRLALADEITAEGQSAPLILDDPLVNLDDDRLDASLGMLAHTAGRRQVLLLTCHGQQADLARRKADCRVLEIA